MKEKATEMVQETTSDVMEVVTEVKPSFLASKKFIIGAGLAIVAVGTIVLVKKFRAAKDEDADVE